MFATGLNKGNTERPLNLYYGVFSVKMLHVRTLEFWTFIFEQSDWLLAVPPC